MLNAGIVDPAKVVRVALQDAASVAGLMITTEAMVAETPKKKEAPAMPGGGMGGYGLLISSDVELGTAALTLAPGDIIATGTPPGVAMSVKPEPAWLKPGDLVELGVHGLGKQKQRVVAAQP